MVVLLVYVNDFYYYRNCLYTTGTSIALRIEQVNEEKPRLRFESANRVGPGSGRDTMPQSKPSIPCQKPTTTHKVKVTKLEILQTFILEEKPSSLIHNIQYPPTTDMPLYVHLKLKYFDDNLEIHH